MRWPSSANPLANNHNGTTGSRFAKRGLRFGSDTKVHSYRAGVLTAVWGTLGLFRMKKWLMHQRLRPARFHSHQLVALATIANRTECGGRVWEARADTTLRWCANAHTRSAVHRTVGS